VSGIEPGGKAITDMFRRMILTARTLLMNVLVTLAVLFGASASYAAEPLIAVAAEGPGAQPAVSAVAARAPQILIFDVKGKLLAAHPNPVDANRSGAGPALARWLAEKQVTLLIAGDVGDKMASELQRLNIRSVTASGAAGQT
jgi:predicted Fe-Mo cluster-binding NifX family protein